MECNQMCLIVVIWENRILTECGVVITAALGGTGTGIVLHDGHHGIAAPAQVSVAVPSGLHSGNEALGDVAAQCRIFAVGFKATLHDGSGHQVNLGSQQSIDTHCTILGGVSLSHIHGHFRIHCRSQGQALHQSGLVVGVDGDQGRDAVVQLFTQFLNQIHPLGMVHGILGGGAGVAGNAAAAATKNIGIAGVFVAAKGFTICGEGTQTAMGQVRSNFFAAHLVDQITGTGLVAFTPVFVNVQLAILVQVLKSKAVNLQQLHAGILGIA